MKTGILYEKQAPSTSKHSTNKGYHSSDDLVFIIMNYIQSGSLHDIIYLKVMHVIILVCLCHTHNNNNNNLHVTYWSRLTGTQLGVKTLICFNV